MAKIGMLDPEGKVLKLETLELVAPPQIKEVSCPKIDEN